MSGAPGSLSRRASGPTAESAPILHQLLEAAVVALEDHGVSTSSDGQIVGGVALAQPFYAASLYFEGRDPEGQAAAPFHVALACRAVDSTGPSSALRLVFATREELAAGAAPLPSDAAPVIAQLLSPEAISMYHWARPPAVLLFGACPAGAGNDEALDACELAGIPVSPSMTGPHPEELVTQLQVFFKQFRFPEHAAFVLADQGFMVFGDSIEDAAATYDTTIRPALLLAAADPTGATTPKAPTGGLAGALRKLSGLLQRSQSDTAASAAGASVGPSSASGAASPMLGVLQATRAKFARSTSAGNSTCGVAASAMAASVAGARAPGGVDGSGIPEEDGGERSPSEIRAAPAVVSHGPDQRHPTIQTGLRPW